MPGKFAGLLFLLFLKIRFAHDRRPATPALWEAGANPALPRNCKRGQWRTSTRSNLRYENSEDSEVPGKDAAASRTRSESLLASQETGVNHRLKPFRVQRRMVCVILVFCCFSSRFLRRRFLPRRSWISTSRLSIRTRPRWLGRKYRSTVRARPLRCRFEARRVRARRYFIWTTQPDCERRFSPQDSRWPGRRWKTLRHRQRRSNFK